jgi:glycine betaine/proline transport system substrate-binding protein
VATPGDAASQVRGSRPPVRVLPPRLPAPGAVAVPLPRPRRLREARPRRLLALGALAALLLPLAACTGQDAREAAAPAPPAAGGTVRIALNEWAGYQAGAAVIGRLLTQELGYRVQTVALTPAESWEGLEKGTVDVIVENWGRGAEAHLHRGEKGRGLRGKDRRQGRHRLVRPPVDGGQVSRDHRLAAAQHIRPSL